MVVDTSASMATETGDGTRFDRAASAAADTNAGEVSVVASAPTPQTVLTRGDAEEAREAVRGLSVTDAPGDLRGAIAEASQLGGDDARVVVFSDFAGESAWQDAVATARARGQTVSVQQFDGGGTDNVGIVDLAFTPTEVTVTVKNTGTDRAQRDLAFAGSSRSLDLAPGDVAVRTFELPADGGEVQLSPGDSFPTDDSAVVVAPESRTIRALLLTNSENRFIRTALDVSPGVDLTVRRPPAAISDEFDVIVFGDVESSELLDSSVRAAEETLADGGGVVVQGQDDLGQLGLEGVSPVDPGPVENTSGMGAQTVTEDRLTAGITFPVPERHVDGELVAGRALVNLSDDTPVLARSQVDEGRVMYYGYLPNPNGSAFSFAAEYPVFWQRAANELSGRPRPASLNRPTGARVEFDADRVQAPDGTRSGSVVVLDRAGAYGTDQRRLGASLRNIEESNVTAPAIDAATRQSDGDVTEQRPLEVTPLVAAVALVLLLVEAGYLYYRGDL